MGNQIFLTVLSLSLSGTLVGMLILCIRPLTRRVFSKRWNYYVWLVMVARLILPISLGINLTGYLFAAGNEWSSVRAESSVREEMLNGEIEPGTERTEPVEKTEPIEKTGPVERTESVEKTGPVERIEPVEKAGAVEMGGQPGNVRPAIAGGKQQQADPLEDRDFGRNEHPLLSCFWVIWLLGAVLAACIKGNDYRNFAAYMKAGRQEIREGRIRELVDELSGRLGIKRTVKVYESPLGSSPILIGLLRPCIILPKETVGQGDISLILHHELIHYKKKDLWYKWLYQAVLCIHWFNPLLYLIGTKLNMDCELACDEAVMGILTEEGRKAYGNVLLDAAEHKLDFKKSMLSTTLLEDKATLKERLNAILRYKKAKGVLTVLSVCLLGVIVVLAGFAGVKNSKTYKSHSPAWAPMAGSYASFWETMSDVYDSGREDVSNGYTSGWEDVPNGYTSGWDNMSAGYTSLWDSFGGAVGTLWDGIGQMWGELGDALSDAMSSIEDREKNIWGYFGVDQFLFQTTHFDTHGEAWKVYEDDKAIAGEDIYDRWSAYHYVGGLDVDCKGLILNGSDTCEILYAKEGFPQTLDFEAELVAGKMKLVHVGADGTVALLAELEEGDSFRDSVNISLTEGRNAVKVVGQGAKIKSLSLKFGDQKNRNILKLFTSDIEEMATMICDEFCNGNLDVEKLMDTLPYLNADELCECAKMAFDSGADLTIDQVSDLLIYGNTDVGKYLADAVEKGSMEPFTGEEITEELIYYISSADALRLVGSMDEPLDFDMLVDLLIYLNAEDGEKCLDIYLGQGNELSYEEFLQISYYLNEDAVKRLYEKER